MLTHGEDVEAQALRQRGWSISAIALHLNRDPKTARPISTLSGGLVGGSVPAPIHLLCSCRTVGAVRRRSASLGATALFDEVVPGYCGQLREFRVAGGARSIGVSHRW
jgi:hypothetical protein